MDVSVHEARSGNDIYLLCDPGMQARFCRIQPTSNGDIVAMSDARPMEPVVYRREAFGSRHRESIILGMVVGWDR